MDSVTQVLLGSATAALVAPKHDRKRAILVGAGLGTLPDLDVFLHYGQDVLDFTRHRSFSHSLLVLPVVAAVLLPLLRRVFVGMSWRRLYVLAALPLITHPLLDAFTSYGTQLFWPIPVTPTFFASVFIVDPFYSLWLLLGLVVYWLYARLKWVNALAVLMSTAYLFTGLWVQQLAREQLVAAFPNTQADDWYVGVMSASPLCWHGVLVRGEDYIETAFNVLNPDEMVVEQYEILPMNQSAGSLTLLRWFNPNTVARIKEGAVVSSDLRLGEFGRYVFEFVVAPSTRDGVQIPRFSGDWRPVSVNAASNTYRQHEQEHNGSYPMQKWMQFQRCLHGGV